MAWRMVALNRDFVRSGFCFLGYVSRQGSINGVG